MDEATNPLGEVDAVNAIAGMLDGPDDREPEEQEEIEEEPQEVEAEATEEEPEAEAPEELEEITWNSETKKVSKSELKELAQKGFDYTQKTQELAETKRQFEAQAKAFQESLQIQNQQIEVVAEIKSLDGQLAQFKEVNWHALAESDPVQYLKLNQTFRDLKETRDAKVQHFHQAAQYLSQQQHQAQTQSLQREAKALADAIPEFRGEKANETKQKVKSYLKEAGFNDAEIGAVTDHRAIKLAWEAAQWRALQASKPALTKRVAETPKPVKAGPPKTQTTQASKDAYTALRKTGRGEYAAKLIESMI